MGNSDSTPIETNENLEKLLDDEDDSFEDDKVFGEANSAGYYKVNDNLETPEEEHSDIKNDSFSTCSFISHQAVSSSFDPFCNLKNLDGWSLTVHEVKRGETLNGIALRYGVTSDAIKQMNFMTDDRLTSYCNLLIPPRGSNAVNYHDTNGKEGNNYNNPVKTEQERDHLIQLLAKMDRSNLGVHAAEYYLTSNDFNLRSAIKQSEQDDAWEQKHGKKKQIPGWVVENRLTSE